MAALGCSAFWCHGHLSEVTQQPAGKTSLWSLYALVMRPYVLKPQAQITHKEHLEIFHNALQAELRVEVHNPNHFAPSISKVVIVDNKVPQGSRGQISEVTPPLPSTSNVVAKSFPLNSSLADDERNQSGLNQLDFSISSQVLQQDEQQQQKEPLLHVKLDLCPYPFHFSRTILFLSDSSPFR